MLSIDSGLRTDGRRATKGIMEPEKAETSRKIRIFQHLGLLYGRWFVRKRVRNLTENLREIYTIIRDRVKDRERDKDIIIARSSNLLRSLASKPAPEFPMKGLSDHGYLEPGEPIAIRGDRASDDE